MNRNPPFWLTALIILISLPLTMLIYWMIVGTSLESAVDFSAFFEAFSNSLLVSGLGAGLTVLCALPLVWSAVRYRSRLTLWIDRLPYLLHAVPGLVIALSLVYFTINYAYSFYQTFFMVVVAYFMLYLPMAKTTLRSSLEQISDNVEKVGCRSKCGRFLTRFSSGFFVEKEEIP